MKKQPPEIDICIICALYEEAKAVINEFSERCSTHFIQEFSRMDRYEYQYATIQNKQGKDLTVLVTWLSGSGPVQTGLDLKPFLYEFHPRLAAMTGFCAGDKRKVRLGDLVVAQYAYLYEEGKIVKESEEPPHLLPEMQTSNPTSQIIQYVNGFVGWKEPVSKLKLPELDPRLKSNREREPLCIIAPMASGMAVRGDDPFLMLQEKYNRNTVGLDMEAATFYRALRAVTHIQGLVVKGVCDYADMNKNNGYHEYAARASAVYLLYFIQEYVNEKTTLRRNVSSSSNYTNLSKVRNIFRIHIYKPHFIKQYQRIIAIGFIVIFLAILLGRNIYFMNHRTSIHLEPTITMPIHPEPTIPQQQQPSATQILKKFCTYLTDLENSKYPNINGLIAPKTLANNEGDAKVLQGWISMDVKTCQPGTVQREANTNVFIGTFIYSRINSPTKYTYQITIDNSDGPWKITDWGTADRTDPQKTIGIYCSALQTNNPDILYSLIPQARWKKVQIAFFPDCTPDSDAGVSCSPNRQILYIYGGGRKRSVLLQLINEQWFIVDYEDLSSANHSNCQDDNNLPKISMVSYDQKVQS